MKDPPLNRHMPRIFKSALLGGLLMALAQSSSGAIEQQQNPIQSFSANPSTITAGHTTTLWWVIEGAENVRLSGISATPSSLGWNRRASTIGTERNPRTLWESATRNHFQFSPRK